MPHKLYTCCDRNTCECGEGERFSYSENARTNKKINIEDLTDLQLQKEIDKRLKLKQIKLQNNQINEPILQEIKRLEKHLEIKIKELKSKLR